MSIRLVVLLSPSNPDTPQLWSDRNHPGPREPVEGAGVAPGVAADRHPGDQLLADEVGVTLDLAADDKEGGRRLSLGEKGQDPVGGARPGAVVKVSATGSGPGLPPAGWKATGTTRPESFPCPRQLETRQLEATASLGR